MSGRAITRGKLGIPAYNPAGQGGDEAAHRGSEGEPAKVLYSFFAKQTQALSDEISKRNAWGSGDCRNRHDKNAVGLF
jgi:hypothetical protein